MATTTNASTSKDADGLVEMAWDPITRIVGSLGHLHQDRLRHRPGRRVPQHVVDLPGLQHLHEGQGPARRPLHHQPHLRHLRRQPRHLLVLRPEHGLRRAPAGARRVDRQPRRGRRVHVRPQHLPGEPGRGRLLREDGRRDQPGRARAGQRAPRRPTPATTATSTIGDIMRSLNPFSRRVLPRGAPGQPVHAGDVLPHGGPPRAPLHPVPGRRRHHRHHPALHRLLHAPDALRGVHEAGRAHARRPVRLLLRGPARLRGGRPAPHPARLLGRLPGPGRLQLRLPRHDRVGPGHVRHPRASIVDGELVTNDLVDINLGIRILLGSSFYDDWEDQEMFVDPRPARQPGRPPPPVEPAHQPPAAEARLRRQVQLGHVAPLVRRHRPPRPRHRRRPARPAVVDGPVGPRRHRLRQGHRHTACEIHLPRTALKPEVTLEWKIPQWSNTIERDRARTYFQAYAAAAALDFIEKALAEVRAGQHQDVGAVRGARRGHRLRLHRGGAGRALAPHGDQGRQDRQLPPVPADAVEREPPRRLRHRRPLRGRRHGHADLRGERPSSTSRASTSCAPCAASTPACPAASTCTSARARC